MAEDRSSPDTLARIVEGAARFNVSLGFGSLMAGDVQGRDRAFQSMGRWGYGPVRALRRFRGYSEESMP